MSEKWVRQDVFVLMAACVVLVVFRLHAFSVPLETDECNYAYIGERLVEGGRLYVDVWDHQPPGIFALTSAVGTVFGFGPFVWRGLATVASCLTLVLLFSICRRYMGRPASWLAAGLFAMASSDPGIAGEGCNREIYMNVLSVASLYLVLRGYWWGVLGAGICLGLSSLLKTVAAAQWLFLVPVVLVFPILRSIGEPLKRLMWFCIGPLTIWAVTFGYFAATDRLEVFVDATFVYNLGYGNVDVPLWEKFGSFFEARSVFVSLLGLWIAGVGGHFCLRWRGARGTALGVSGFALGSFVAVCLPGKFWPHYYLLFLPSLILGSVVAWNRLPGRIMPTIYAVLLSVSVLAGQFVYYLNLPPDRIAAPRYGDRMSWALEHGLRIAKVTDPDDYVYVCGIDTGMYYYSRRRCPTRYTLATTLVGDDDASRARRKTFLADLRERPPRLILIVRNLPYIEELDRFIRQRGYVKIGEDPDRMDILCDPSRPIEAISWSGPVAAHP